MIQPCKIYSLTPTNGRKSFYEKARVHIYPDGSEILFSYGTSVLRKNSNGTFIRLWDGWSCTTGVHIKSFSNLSKKEFMQLPLEG